MLCVGHPLNLQPTNMKSLSSKIHNLKLQIARLQEKLDALENRKSPSKPQLGEKPTGIERFDHICEADGGTSSNRPPDYGKGYGSFQIDGGEIERVTFGDGHSCNSAEILTLVSCLNRIALLQGDCKNRTVLLRSDSTIALKWVRCRQTPSPKTSLEFQKAICELHKAVAKFGRVETQWRGRAKSVELFGH